MKRFIDTTDATFTFSFCEGCPSRCCDGRHGSIFAELILEDFEQVSQNFPIVFTFGELGFLSANVLLSNGKEFCPYVVDHKCTIYEQRPSVCRIYPLSPNINNKIYIDTFCPSLHVQGGVNIVENGEVTENFTHSKLIDYQDKFVQTHYYLEQFSEKSNFEKIGSINEIEFYKFIGKSDDKFIKLHIQSLKNLNKVLQWN